MAVLEAPATVKLADPKSETYQLYRNADGTLSTNYGRDGQPAAGGDPWAGYNVAGIPTTLTPEAKVIASGIEIFQRLTPEDQANVKASLAGNTQYQNALRGQDQDTSGLILGEAARAYAITHNISVAPTPQTAPVLIAVSRVNRDEVPIPRNPKALSLESGAKYETTTTEGKRITLMATDQGFTSQGGNLKGSMERLQELGLQAQPSKDNGFAAEMAKFNAGLSQYGYSRVNPKTGAGEVVELKFDRPKTYKGLEGMTAETNLLGLTPVASTSKGAGYLYTSPVVLKPQTTTTTTVTYKTIADPNDPFPTLNAFKQYTMAIADKIAALPQALQPPSERSKGVSDFNTVVAQAAVGYPSLMLSGIPFAFDLFNIPAGSKQEKNFQRYLGENPLSFQNVFLGGALSAYTRSIIDAKGTQAATTGALIALTTAFPEVGIGRFTIPTLPIVLGAGVVNEVLAAPDDRKLATLAYNVGGAAGVLGFSAWLQKTAKSDVNVEAKARPVQTATQEDFFLLGATKRQGYVEASATAKNVFGQTTTAQTRGATFDVLTIGDRSAVDTQGVFGKGADYAAVARGRITDVTPPNNPIAQYRLEGASANLPRTAVLDEFGQFKDLTFTVTKGTAYQLEPSPIGALKYNAPNAMPTRIIEFGGSVGDASTGIITYGTSEPTLTFRTPKLIEGVGATSTPFFSQEVGLTASGTRLNIRTSGAYVAPTEPIPMDGLLGVPKPNELNGFRMTRAPESGNQPFYFRNPLDPTTWSAPKGTPSTPEVTLPKTPDGMVQLTRTQPAPLDQGQKTIATMAAGMARSVAELAGEQSAKNAATTANALIGAIAAPKFDFSQPQRQKITTIQSVTTFQTLGGTTSTMGQTRANTGTRTIMETLTRTMSEPRILQPPSTPQATRSIVDTRVIQEPRIVQATQTISARAVVEPRPINVPSVVIPVPVPQPVPPIIFGGGGVPLPFFDFDVMGGAKKTKPLKPTYSYSFKAFGEGITYKTTKKPTEKKLAELAAGGIGVRPIILIQPKAQKTATVKAPKPNALNTDNFKNAMASFNFNLPKSLKRALKFR